ncbi:hypothetical protein [Candidatus Poseidonia alphae]|uniref:hypothetical protein n=1 Tax=Candidatus Poseidonia alphae TaxID=1915863 RepID=UPI0030C6D388
MIKIGDVPTLIARNIGVKHCGVIVAIKGPIGVIITNVEIVVKDVLYTTNLMMTMAIMMTIMMMMMMEVMIQAENWVSTPVVQFVTMLLLEVTYQRVSAGKIANRERDVRIVGKQKDIRKQRLLRV